MRAQELLQYYHRAQQRASGQSPAYPPASDTTWENLNEEQASSQFAFMQATCVGPGGLREGVNRIPDKLRELISWAEEKKQEMKGDADG